MSDRVIPLDPIFQPPIRRTKKTYVITLPEDRVALSKALVKIFPRMRFWQHPGNLGGSDVEYALAGLRRIRYLDYLSFIRPGGFGGWIEPEGWQPRWLPPSHDEQFLMFPLSIMNHPTLYFDFFPYTDDPDKLGGPNSRGFLSTRITVGDAEDLAFANGIARAVRSVTSNWWQWVGTVEQAGSVEPGPPKRQNTHLGHHARAVFDANPSKRFWGEYRPADPPGRRAKKA